MKRLLAITLGVALAGVGTVSLAARNASGTHTLPLTNPVIPGTKITAAWANSLTADLSAEITDSLSRSGKGGMTAALRGVNGTVASPGYSFTSDTDSGVYLQAAGNVRVAAAGADALVCTATGVSVPGTLAVTGTSTLTGAATFGDGITIPSNGLFFTQASGQSIYKTNGLFVVGTNDANALDLATNGTARFTVSAAGVMTSAGGTITGLPTPSAASDAATKGYADTVAPAQSKIIAAGDIAPNGASCTLNGVFGATCSRSALGVYVVTLTSPTANFVPVVTTRTAGAAYISAAGASSFTVSLLDAASPPAAVDAAFKFIVVAGP